MREGQFAMFLKTTLAAGLRRIARCRRGSVVIEFAFMVPIFVLIAVSSVELGRLSVEWMRITRAANAGAMRAVQNSITINSDDDIIAAVRDDANDPDALLTVSVDNFWECPANPGVQVAQGFECPDGELAASYLTVTVSQSLDAVFIYLDLPPSYALSVTNFARIN